MRLIYDTRGMTSDCVMILIRHVGYRLHAAMGDFLWNKDSPVVILTLETRYNDSEHDELEKRTRVR